MRKKWILWFSIITLLLVSSCGIENKEINSSLNNQKKEGNNYNVVKESIVEGNITINYPQIIFNNKNTEQNKVNEIIKNEANKVLRYYDNSKEGLNLNIDYKIQRQDEKVLSIQYSGVGFVQGAAHPNNLFFTTNVKMETGTILRLKDSVNINEGFVRKIKDGEFKLLEEDGEIRKEILDNIDLYTAGELVEIFNNADSLDSIGTDNQSDIFSYFTEDSIGISVSVSHVLGDHAELLIRYTDLKDVSL